MYIVQQMCFEEIWLVVVYQISGYSLTSSNRIYVWKATKQGEDWDLLGPSGKCKFRGNSGPFLFDFTGGSGPPKSGGPKGIALMSILMPIGSVYRYNQILLL